MVLLRAKRAIPSSSECSFPSQNMITSFWWLGSQSLESPWYLSLLPSLHPHLLLLTPSLLFLQNAKLTLTLCLRTFALAFPSAYKTFPPDVKAEATIIANAHRLLMPEHCSEHFTCKNSFNPSNERGLYYHLHFYGCGNRHRKLGALPEVAGLGRGGVYHVTTVLSSPSFRSAHNPQGGSPHFLI